MDINASLQSALTDLDLGHYTRATSSLTALRNTHANEAPDYHRITAELIRAHLLRGASLAALEAVDHSLAKFPTSFLEDLETRHPRGELDLDESCVYYLVLRMQKALVGSFVDGLLDGYLKISARIVKLSRPYTPHELSLYPREIASFVHIPVRVEIDRYVLLRSFSSPTLARYPNSPLITE
jgi:hypothetical protein